jgi:hypothetical protein
MKFVISEEDKKYIKSMYGIVNEQQNKSPFIVNGIYKGIRTADNKEYFITILKLSDEIKMGQLNSFLMAKIKGPGVDSQGYPYDGDGEYELYYTAPNELSGNMQTGSFQNLQKVSSKPTTTNTKVSPTAKINTTNDRSYDYKLENGKYYYSKKGQNKWIEAKGKGLESIKSKIKF